MWTDENRGRYDRSLLRYPSDLMDAEWDLVRRLIPSAKRGGRRRTVDLREVANGLMDVLSTGCQWRAVPKDLPPRSTLHDYLSRWQWDGTLERIHHALYVAFSFPASAREFGSDAEVRAAIMRESVAAYHAGGRPCACPYDSARNGYACGGVSAYRRPGRTAPLCYPADVSDAMVREFRQVARQAR